ncbi:9164_t:CDS:2, partial [Gigaspora margarita]
SKLVQVINYYNNDPVPKVISNNELESIAKLKYNFIEIQIISETIIKVQHRNLNDVDEQIDNRIIEIQQEIDIVKDNIKGNYDNLGICFKKMHKEIDNLLEKIETENTKLNVKLWGLTAYEYGIKQ